MIDSVAVLRTDWKGEIRDSWTGLGGSCQMPAKLKGAWMLQDWKCGDKQESQFKEGSPGYAQRLWRGDGGMHLHLKAWDAGVQTGCAYRGSVTASLAPDTYYILHQCLLSGRHMVVLLILLIETES